MSIRRSKAYAGFKSVNGVLFVVLGAIIIVQTARVAWPGHLAALLQGGVLGAAMIGLGLYRMVALARPAK